MWTAPPVARAAKTRSASVLSSATIETWKLLPYVTPGPIPSTASLAMRCTASVRGIWACMTFALTASGTLGMNGVSSKVCIMTILVPKTVS